MSIETDLAFARLRTEEVWSLYNALMDDYKLLTKDFEKAQARIKELEHERAEMIFAMGFLRGEG